jgi:hypothetical protein
MNQYALRIELKSDATFGRGDGVAGLVDAEVEHDENGLPFLRGRTLKGLLQEECANILFSLQHLGVSRFDRSADRLFGKPGSDLDADAAMHVSDAVFPDELRRAIHFELHKANSTLQASDILDALTTVRRQTAMSETGAPKQESLRSIRVVLRDTVFQAPLRFAFDFETSPEEVCLLGACAASLRRVGLGRNRGRGNVCADLIKDDEPITAMCLKVFADMVPEKESEQ